MIPTQTFESYPEFANNGTKIAPDAAKYAAGFAQADVLPAEWMNWAWGHNTRGITALNQGLLAVEKELNAVLTAGGQTPNNTDGQLNNAIQYEITAKTGDLTELTTTAKNTLVAATNEVKSALGTHTAGTGSSVHGATANATAGAIIARDASGKASVETVEINPVNPTKEIINMESLVNCITPVGFVYTQLPGEKSPTELGLFGTWTMLNIGGAFLRAEGGDAKTFTVPMKITNISGTLITVDNSDAGTAGSLSTLAVGDLLINDTEYRTVTAISGAVITVNSAFSRSDLTTVLIGQSDCFQGHMHRTGIDGSSGGYVTAYNGNQSGNSGYANNSTSVPITDRINGNPRYGSETRSKNITVRYWKRTA